MVYHPEYKGVRLDVIAADEKRTHYNVEMQVLRKKNLGKRSRYYHSQIDIEIFLAGMEYGKLPDSYVIFVCDFDPFYKKKYKYTFDTVCKEDQTQDDFVQRLQDAVRIVKASREMEERYMLLEEMLKEERESGRIEGKAEAVIDLLSYLGEVPEALREKIISEKEPEVMRCYLRNAAAAMSIEEFQELIRQI